MANDSTSTKKSRPSDRQHRAGFVKQIHENQANDTPDLRERAMLFAKAQAKGGFALAHLHEYADSDGNPVYWRYRMEKPTPGGKADKQIRPFRFDGKGFALGEPAFKHGKPLYRLHQIEADKTAEVWLVEGEICADTLANLGLLATTSGGATSINTTDWQPLEGRAVVLWHDNDEPGRKFRDSITTVLLDLGCTVEVVDVDRLGLPEKGDCVDWLADHPGAGAAGILSLPRVKAVSGKAAVVGMDWPDPVPLPESLSPVEPFYETILPETLMPWAADIADRLQCAPDYLGVSIMASLGAVLGRKIGIRPQLMTDWAEYPNQWAMLIGRPSMMKSPSMAEALKPLEWLEKRANERYQAELAEFKLDERANKIRLEESERAARKAYSEKNASTKADIKKLLEIADETPPPTLRRYKTNEATHGALGEIHRQNPNGLLVFRDELVSLLKTLDREENSDARGFYLTGWGGNSPYTIDRVGRGLNLHIPAVCLSLLGSTQPGKIAPYVQQAIQGGEGDDGLLQRFGLMVWPDKTDWQDVDRVPDIEAKHEAFRVFQYLDELDPAAIGAVQDTNHEGEPVGVPYLRLSPDAHELFLEWRIGFERRLAGDEMPQAMESHLAKYRKLVPSLALITHLAERGRGAVSQGAMLKALAWSEYLESHAKRVYGAAVQAEAHTASLIIKKIRAGALPDSFSSRQVWRPGWSGLSNSDAVKKALELLVEYDWLHAEKADTGGRFALSYTVNPKVKP